MMRSILTIFSFFILSDCLIAQPAKDIIIFVNGFWGKQKLSPCRCNLACYWQYDSITIKPRTQWNYNQTQAELFFQECYQYFKTSHVIFVDGGHFMPITKAKKRRKKGIKYIDNQLVTILNTTKIDTNSLVHFVTHSMGAAYAEGMIEAMLKRNYRVGEVIHLSPSEAGDIRTFSNVKGPQKRIQIISQSDVTVKNVNRWHRYKKDNLIRAIPNIDYFACFYESELTRPQAGDIGHALHIRKFAFDVIKDIQQIKLCGDANSCFILENCSNKIPYRKICIHKECVLFDKNKGYFIKSKFH
jgi:hypothetical protein